MEILSYDKKIYFFSNRENKSKRELLNLYARLSHTPFHIHLSLVLYSYFLLIHFLCEFSFQCAFCLRLQVNYIVLFYTY